ncbi:MAG TPA: beta-propeller fold lactonase family protein, partial [Pirellulales bacterium]
MNWRRWTIPCGIALCLAVPVLAEDAPPTVRVLPGLQLDGFVQLPNGWKLSPAGKSLALGDLPVNIQIHPTGQFAAVIHCGYRDHEVHILDLNPAKRKIVCRVTIDQGFYGLAFSPDGRQLYASGGEFDLIHVWDFDRGLLHNHRTLDVAGEAKDQRTVPSGLVLDPAGRDLFACALWANAVVRVPLDNPENKVFIPLADVAPPRPVAPQGDPPSPPDGRKEPPKADEPNAAAAPVAEEREPQPANNNGYPYTALLEPGAKRLFVSLWAKAAVAVIDLETNKVAAVWKTASHPTEMAIDPQGRALYVSCSNSTQVTVLDPQTGATLQTLVAALYPQAPSGNTPNSLTLTPDGEMLLVANADANNVAVFNVADPQVGKPLGFIPVGWYPTSVRYNKLDKTIYVANGKGALSKANPSGANPYLGAKNTAEYIGGLFQGTLSFLPVPSPAEMATLSQTAYACSPLQKESAVRAEGVAKDNPIPQKIGDPSPIKHVIYIVKENRTYDQIFGDMAARPKNPKGNGS